MAVSAPFTRAVVAAVSHLYPDGWADKSFDNTGLLLEAPYHSDRPRQRNSVLLAIDLTRAVADEAISRKDSIIVTYHPIIFRGLKSLTFADSQQESLLKLASEGISVYSVHTAIDAAPGGNADWLADIITGHYITDPPGNGKEQRRRTNGKNISGSRSSLDVTLGGDNASSRKRRYEPTGELVDEGTLHHFTPHQAVDGEFSYNVVFHERFPINPLSANVPPPPPPAAGMGRIVRFKETQRLPDILARLHTGLGHPRAFQLAIPQNTNVSDIKIRAVGICAGSGGSLLADLPAGLNAAENAQIFLPRNVESRPDGRSPQVDLLLTGELSHHETLAAIERGQSVIALAHSNSERGYLSQVMQKRLQKAVEKEWSEMLEHADDPNLIEYENDASVEIAVSKEDRDPYGIWIAP